MNNVLFFLCISVCICLLNASSVLQSLAKLDVQKGNTAHNN